VRKHGGQLQVRAKLPATPLLPVCDGGTHTQLKKLKRKEKNRHQSKANSVQKNTEGPQTFGGCSF